MDHDGSQGNGAIAVGDDLERVLGVRQILGEDVTIFGGRASGRMVTAD